MGFFASGSKRQSNRDGMPSLELIHRLECKICPLNKVENNTPHMPPSGAKEPLVYILGTAPGASEDRVGKPKFSGDHGIPLHRCIPDEMLPLIRWNNVVRTRPPGKPQRPPEKIEIEACRPSIERDIAATKPKAIFGFGSVPLRWAINQSDIRAWRGRRIPVEIAGHACWYYAFANPAELLQIRRRDGSISEEERAFQFDLKRAFAEVEELPEPVIFSPADAGSNIELIECSTAGLARLEQLMRWAMAQPAVGVDYETSGKRPYGETATILSAAIGTPKQSFAFAIKHPEAKWTQDQLVRVTELWLEFLEAPVRKLVHNWMFEAEWSAYFFGERILRKSRWDCSYIQAAVLDERIGDRKPGCLGLEFLILQHFGFNLKSLSPLDRKDLGKEPLNEVLRYNAMDAKFHYYLWKAQSDLLEAFGLQAVYEQTLRRVPALALTQIKGVPVDQKEVNKLRIKYEDRIKEVEKEIMAFPEVETFRRRMKRTFSPTSNPDMVIMLRDILQSRAGAGDLGAYAVDESVLAKVKHPMMPLILKHRKASKRLSTYILPYAEGSETVWPDGLVHANINPIGTVSHRTSSDEPNIQNIPKRDGEAKEVRRQLKAPPGHVWCAVDFGQIQARNIAMMSKDKSFVKALWDRYDVHSFWAERIAYEYPKRIGGREFLKDKKVMKDFRGDVKNQWTFPLFFGAQLAGIAEYLQIPEQILEPILREFWREFQGIQDWHERMLKAYHRDGYVLGLDGSRFRAPLSKNQLFNYPIQKAEALIVMDAMCRLSEKEVWNYQANLEIHDDLSFILPLEKLDDYVEEIVTEMLVVNFDFINVPLTVEVSIGENLLEMEEVLVASSDTWRK